MGDTLPLQRRGHALEGVSHHGRAAPVCRPPARGRKDGAAVRRVRHLAQDGLQDFRPLQRLRRHRLHRPQPAAVSPGESPAGADRGDDRPPEAGVPRVGRPEDPREIAAAGHRGPAAGGQHGPRRARSVPPGEATAPTTRGRSRGRPNRTGCGARTTRANSCSAIGAIATR
jgi:hypothetical protein